MARTLLAVGALLTVGVGCRDGPTAVTVPSEAVNPDPPAVVAAEVLATMQALLDDPFVHNLIAVADAGRAAKPTRRMMREVMDQVRVGEEHAIVRSLSSARQRLSNDEPETEIERAALGLILNDVQTLLEGEAKVEASEGKPAVREAEGRISR